MTNEAPPSLDDFSQLPDDGDAVFRIGAQLVRFAAREEHGVLAGWVVTTPVRGYIGYLRAGRDTNWTETGPEPMRAYRFEFRGDESARPQFMTGSETDVSLAEFKAIYFGDPSGME